MTNAGQWSAEEKKEIRRSGDKYLRRRRYYGAIDECLLFRSVCTDIRICIRCRKTEFKCRVRRVVFDKFFENRVVLVVLRRSVAVAVYFIAESLIEGGFFIVSIAFINYLTIALSAADHIIHTPLIGKLVIVSKGQSPGSRPAIDERKAQRNEPVTQRLMAPDHDSSLMSGLDQVSIKYQIIPKSIKE